MKRHSLLLLWLIGFVLMALVAVDTVRGTEPESPEEASEEVEGLWAYTALIPKGREEFHLTGLFAFKDGMFVQQSINNGEPFEEQGAMAHAGTYTSGPEGIQMVAEQTISISPTRTPPFRFRRNTKHEIAVERSGDALKLTFGSGTVQTFKRLGEGNGELHPLEQGILTFVDGHFLLVTGDEDGVVTGCGTFERDGESYALEVLRWADAQGSEASYQRDVTVKATFDGNVLTLADGRSFRVKSKGGTDG